MNKCSERYSLVFASFYVSLESNIVTLNESPQSAS